MSCRRIDSLAITVFSDKRLFRHEQETHAFSGHCAWSLHLGQILQRFGDFIEHRISLVFVQHLPSAEEYCELHLVAFFKEFTGVSEFDVEVVFVGFRSQSDFLQRCGMVMMFFMRLANLSFLLVKPLAVVHYPTDRWVARWCDFHKVQTGFTCPAHCLAYIYDSRLIV